MFKFPKMIDITEFFLPFYTIVGIHNFYVNFHLYFNDTYISFYKSTNFRKIIHVLVYVLFLQSNI